VAADEGGVEGQGHGQAEQVLEAGHHGQVPTHNSGLSNIP